MNIILFSCPSGEHHPAIIIVIIIVKLHYGFIHHQVNIILPLSGRLTTFHRFVRQLVHVIYPADKRVFLTVVYFGTEGLQEAREVRKKERKFIGTP